jgi:hypothetical protein
MALVIGVVSLAGPLISWFSAGADRSPIPAWLFAVSVAGIWVTVPDTEEALVLLGAVAVPTLLAWPMRVARLGPIGSHALLGLYMWVIAWGGRGREGSIIGATAALAMLVAAPLSARLAGKPRVTTAGGPGLWVLSIDLVLVAVVTRVAGLRSHSLGALAVVGPSLLAASLLWVAIERRLPHPVVDALNTGREITPEDV